MIALLLIIGFQIVSTLDQASASDIRECNEYAFQNIQQNAQLSFTPAGRSHYDLLYTNCIRSRGYEPKHPYASPGDPISQ